MRNIEKLTVLIDMDDTIENLCECWVNHLNEKHGTTATLDDVTCWDMCVAFPTLTKDEVYAPLFELEMWEKVRPLPHAVEVIERIIKDGHKVVIVTATHPSNFAIKSAFLNKYFPYITYNDVIVTSQKQLVKGDILIDDAPHNHEGGEYYSILMSAAHNRNYDAINHGMIRVNDWEEIYQIIKLFANAKSLNKEMFDAAKIARRDFYAK